MASGEPTGGELAILWYYTTRNKLGEILAEGSIRPATTGVPSKEKAAVWFSANQEWDPAANLPWQDPGGSQSRLSKDQTYVLGGGLARIGVAPQTAVHDWKAFKRLSGISAKAAKEVYNTAVQAGSRPGQWFASFESVLKSQWLRVEILDGDDWVVGKT